MKQPRAAGRSGRGRVRRRTSHQRGLDNDILLVITGEFGRTPRINGSAGRDHWAPLSTLALAGGGLRMGQVVGESSAKAEVPKTTPITPQDLMATVFHVLGMPQDLHYNDPTGRPMPMIDGGKPIAELIVGEPGASATGGSLQLPPVADALGSPNPVVQSTPLATSGIVTLTIPRAGRSTCFTRATRKRTASRTLRTAFPGISAATRRPASDSRVDSSCRIGQDARPSRRTADGHAPHHLGTSGTRRH